MNGVDSIRFCDHICHKQWSGLIVLLSHCDHASLLQGSSVHNMERWYAWQVLQGFQNHNHCTRIVVFPVHNVRILQLPINVPNDIVTTNFICSCSDTKPNRFVPCPRPGNMWIWNSAPIIQQPSHLAVPTTWQIQNAMRRWNTISSCSLTPSAESMFCESLQHRMCCALQKTVPRARMAHGVLPAHHDGCQII
jgi:hypothetical protein